MADPQFSFPDLYPPDVQHQKIDYVFYIDNKSIHQNIISTTGPFVIYLSEDRCHWGATTLRYTEILQVGDSIPNSIRWTVLYHEHRKPEWEEVRKYLISDLIPMLPPLELSYNDLDRFSDLEE